MDSWDLLGGREELTFELLLLRKETLLGGGLESDTSAKIRLLKKAARVHFGPESP